MNFIKPLVTLLASSSVARAYVLPEFTASGGNSYYGLYSTFAVPDVNVSIELLVSGTPYHVDLSASALAKISPQRPRPLAEVSALQERDICAYAQGCFQYAADRATTAALYIANTFPSTCSTAYRAALAYWTDNNYANLNAVIQNAIVSFVINIASTPVGDALWNVHNAQTEGHDGCSVDTDKPRTADRYAAALYDFCMTIQEAQSVNSAPREIVFGQLSDNEQFNGHGVGVVKQFIAAQAHNFGPTCRDFGVEWKRGLEAAGGL